jgi:hypothetical protein
MVISLDSLDSVSMYNDRSTVYLSASSLTLVGRYTVDLSLYMDTLSRLITYSLRTYSLIIVLAH